MRITSIDTLQVPELRNVLWVRVTTDDGAFGLGETFRGADAAAAHIHADIAPHLLGADPLQIDRHNRTMTGGYLGFRSSGAEMRAASAVDIALWDLWGRSTGQPVHQLLGGLSRDSIRTYNTCAGYTYNKGGGRRLMKAGESVAEAEGPYEDQRAFMTDAGALAESLLDQGVTAMKIWPFDPHAGDGRFIHAADIDLAVEPLRKIRDRVGRRMEVMLEMHSLWDLPAALAIARRVREFEPFWMEDPIKMEDPAALADYARRSGLPVCASETLATRASFRDLLQRDAVDYVMLDVSWCGGLTEAKKIATLAEAHQRPVAPHDCTGPIVFAASIHLALNATNAIFQESVRAYYTGWYGDYVDSVPQPVRGAFMPSLRPGLGVDLDPGLWTRPDAVVRTSRL